MTTGKASKSKKKEPKINIDELPPATVEEVMFEKLEIKSEAIQVTLKDGTKKKLRVKYKKGTYRELATMSKVGTGDEAENYWPLLIHMYSVEPKFDSLDQVLDQMPYGFVRTYALRIETFNSENPFLF